MAPDGVPAPGSQAPTPAFQTPSVSRPGTPLPQQNGGVHGLADYLSAPLGKGGHLKAKTFLAGSKALDSLVRFIASTEGFFHPSNSGSWTNDVSCRVTAFLSPFPDTMRAAQRIRQVHRI